MDFTIIDRFCGSTFWDSELSWNTTIPRLTPCIEKTVLVWLPTIFLLAFSVIDIYSTLSSKSRSIPWNWKNRGQLVILGLIATMQIIDLSYSLNRSEEIFLVDLYTPVIKCISLALCWTLVVLHRIYGQRSSGLLFIFWFLMVLTGSSQFYTELERLLTSVQGELLRITYIISYCLSIILFLMQWLTDLPPMDNKHPVTKGNENPEESASFPSKLTFSWFDSLIWKGYRNALTRSDLWSTKYQDTAAELFAAFNKHWEPAYKRFSKSDKMMNGRPKGKASFDHISETVVKDSKKPASILLALLKAFGPAYLIATSLQAMDVMLAFVSPELLKIMINFISSNEPPWRGYLYAVMLLLVSVIQAFIQAQYNIRVGSVGLRIRTAVTSAIYRKALKLSNSARKDSTLGEIVNLMSVDSQSLMNSLTFLNSLFFAPVYICLALYFLWQQLGPCALTGLAIILVMIPINSYFLNMTKKLQRKQMKYKDERTKMMNEVLSGMKVLKLYTWEPSFEDKISAIRNKEVNILRKAAYLKSLTFYIWSLAPFLVALLTFTAYVMVDESHILDSAKVFVSMSLFNIMQNPLILVPIVVSHLATASVSLKRINKFLNLEELNPARIIYDDQDEDPLVIENGTFFWDIHEEPILHNINLRVKPGLLVAVVGAIGCGKSSLISAFLGEMYKSFSKVTTKGSIAYVPQVAWIQNSTLQDNILFGKSLDRKRYSNVIEACSLRQDLEMITGGDQCEIGERGINISGGQKQRISLARAVYADCDVYLLDDPLSAVDAHVGKHIFENVIGPKGILGRKTRLLVSHGVSFLPEVDLIVVLKNGMISELGTYRELLNKKGAFSEFLITHLHEVDEEELKDLDIVIREEIIGSNPELHRHLSRQKSVNSFTGSMSSLKKRRLSQISQNIVNEEPKGKKLIEDEKSKVGRAGWSVYSDYLSSVGITLFSTTLVLTVLQQGMGVGANYWLSLWADDKDLVINGTQNIEKRNLYLIVYGLMGLCQTSANFFGSLLWFIGAANATIILHSALLGNIMRSPMSFFDTTPLGRILNRFAKEVDVLDNFVPFLFRQSLSFLFSVISTLSIISYSTPIFIAVIVPIMVLYYMVQVISLTFLIGSMETGATVIRAYRAQDRFIKDSEIKVDINQDYGYLINIASRWQTIRFQLIGNTIIFFSALFAVIGKDYLSPGLVGLSISYTLQVTGMLNMLFTMSADLENNIIAVERIKEYTVTAQEAAWNITPSPVGADWPREGRVEFSDYCLRYREGLDLVLKRINVVINGREKVGIVGRTGAGKSSVTLGLFRIIEPASGKILIDGVDISKLGLHCVRSCLTIIPQEPVLFSGSLRMNLDPFDHFGDEQVWKAVELAGLKSFVKGLAAGLQHEVAEGGENISVGQRQLICLARALLRKTKILVLDEATAAVDLETDDIIQKTIRSEFADSTVLTIAHRINTIMDSDKVLVLDHGSVLEYDSPNELMKNKSSAFYSMAHEAGLV